MQGRQPKKSANSFARGADLWMHQARAFLLAVCTALLVSVLVGSMVTVAYFWKRTTKIEQYALERNVLAHMRAAVYMTAGKMELKVDEKLYKLGVSEVAALTESLAAEAWKKLQNGAQFGGLSSLAMMLLITLYWWAYGREKMQDQQLRGAQLVDVKALARLLRNRKEASPYQIAGVPMRMNTEALHTLFAGAPGTGKSQQFFALMQQVRFQRKRMIVYDASGEFTQMFFREGKDILMNPLDARCPNWNIWNEIVDSHHVENIANGLIPNPANSDPFWAIAGRTVLTHIIEALGQKGRRTNRDLYLAVADSSLEELHRLLEGTAGATYVDPKTDRTGISIKMTLQNQIGAFRFLSDQGESFSIRKWIQEESDSWMFITARESMREVLKPLLSLWIDTAIKAVLDLSPIHRERLWFCIDELPTLQKLDILKLALTNTRKYGLCIVLGVQDFSQLHEIYGRELSKTIISNCQTKLLLRVTDGSAAKMLVELMGQSEIDEKEETLSYGLDSHRDGVSVFSRRSMRDLVLSSEILKLPDMQGYLILPGDYPIAKVKYGYVAVEKHAEGFVRREVFGTAENDSKSLNALADAL